MRRTIALFVTIGLICTSFVFSQRPPDGKAWVSLFNGQDLTGWVRVGQEKWTVDNGVIHGEGVTEKYGYLVTEKKYSDFHLFLRFKCLAGGNSGVYFHTDFKPGTVCLLYTSPSPRDLSTSRMPSSA